MPYHVYKDPKAKSGWRILFEYWEDGKRRRRTIPKPEWLDLGIDPRMSPKQVKMKLRPLNATEERKLTEKRRHKASAIRDEVRSLESAHLPQGVVEAFRASNEIREVHWNAACRAISKAGTLSIDEWGENPEPFYKYFESKRWSTDYIRRILRVINRWGRFLAKRTKQSWTEDIAPPTGKFRARIVKANRTAKTRKKPIPLTLTELKSARGKIPDENYTWLFVAIAFGLRPEEVDPNHWRRSESEGYEWLSVWQPKLDRMGYEEDKVWKHIPVIEQRQVEALQLLNAPMRKPIAKTLRKVFPKSVTPYSARHEFKTYMLSRYEKDMVQRWMGHLSSQTMDSYLHTSDLRYIRRLNLRSSGSE